MFAHRQATLNNTSLTKALERLSSGYRINRASDDAAGLAVSEKLRTQVRGYQQASRNIQDGMSMVQVAEAGLQELTEILQRVRELSVQAASGILTASDRTLIQIEVDQLLNEINRMQTSVEFNRLKLFDGTFSSTVPLGDANVTTDGTQLPNGSLYVGSIRIHVGASENQILSAYIATLSTQGIGLTSLFSSAGAVVGQFATKPLKYPWEAHRPPYTSVPANGVLTQAKAESAIGIVDSAVNVINRRRATLGAVQNRLEHTNNFVGTVTENLQAAESRIRDTDMAEEVINFTKSQVLVQASQAMLAQANLKPTSILQLLQ